MDIVSEMPEKNWSFREHFREKNKNREKERKKESEEMSVALPRSHDRVKKRQWGGRRRREEKRTFQRGAHVFLNVFCFGLKILLMTDEKKIFFARNYKFFYYSVYV